MRVLSEGGLSAQLENKSAQCNNKSNITRASDDLQGRVERPPQTINRFPSGESERGSREPINLKCLGGTQRDLS